MWFKAHLPQNHLGLGEGQAHETCRCPHLARASLGWGDPGELGIRMVTSSPGEPCAFRLEKLGVQGQWGWGSPRYQES